MEENHKEDGTDHRGGKDELEVHNLTENQERKSIEGRGTLGLI